MSSDPAVASPGAMREIERLRTLLREIAAKAVRNKHNLNWLEVTLRQDELDAIIEAATVRAAEGRSDATKPD